MQNYFNEKDKYYINSQKYSECQLVSAINAAIFLNEIPVIKDSIEYERLVDLVHARNGSAISIKYAHQYLRLVATKLDFIDFSILKNFLDNKNPIEAKIYHKKTGLHSVLIIDHYRKEGNHLRVLNCKQITDNKGWVEWKILKKYFWKTLPSGWAFELNPWYLRDLQIKNNQKIIRRMI